MAFKQVEAADVLDLFRRQNIQVQTATPKKAKGEDGKVRETFDVKMAPLSADGVLMAKQFDDGLVVITTIDGRRYQAKGEAPKPAKEDKKDAK